MCAVFKRHVPKRTIPEMKTTNPPKQISGLGKDAEGFYFLCYGPDRLTLRSDLNKALSAVKIPKLVAISDVQSRQLSCVIVKGEIEELERIRKYLATQGRYAYRESPLGRHPPTRLR